MFLSAGLFTSPVCSVSLLDIPSQGQALSLVFIFWHVYPIAEGPVWLLVQQIFTSRAADVYGLYMWSIVQHIAANAKMRFCWRRWQNESVLSISIEHLAAFPDKSHCSQCYIYLTGQTITSTRRKPAFISLPLVMITRARCFVFSQLFKPAGLKMDRSSTQFFL